MAEEGEHDSQSLATPNSLANCAAHLCSSTSVDLLRPVVTLHVSVRPAVRRTPRLHVVVVSFVASVLACPEPLVPELEHLRWCYPAGSRTLDSFFIALSPFSCCLARKKKVTIPRPLQVPAVFKAAPPNPSGSSSMWPAGNPVDGTTRAPLALRKKEIPTPIPFQVPHVFETWLLTRAVHLPEVGLSRRGLNPRSGGWAYLPYVVIPVRLPLCIRSRPTSFGLGRGTPYRRAQSSRSPAPSP